MKRAAPVALACLLAACTKSPPQEAPATAGSAGGERATFRGKISKLYAQHMMTSVPGKKEQYFDREGASQIIIYVKDTPNCSGLVEVTGTVIKLRGPSKKPGGTETKVDDSYEETQLDVESWKCL
jgi:hypothetical protein